MKRLFLLAAALLLASHTGLSAQQRPAFDPGTRVRIFAPVFSAERITGTVVSADSGWIHVSSKDPAAERWMHLSLVESVEVSRGSRRAARAWRGSSWGAFLGVGLGGIAGAFAAKSLDTGVATTAALGAVGAGLVGGGIGAGIGALTPRDRWHPYRLPSPASAVPLLGRR